MIAAFSFLLPPLLMSVFPVLFFYQTNISELNPKFLELPLLYLTTTALIGVLTLKVIIQDKNKSALITAFILFIFLSYGHFSKFLEKKLFIQLPDGFVLGPDKIFIPLVFLGSLFLIYKILKSKTDFTRAISYINIVLLILTGYSSIFIVKSELQKPRFKSASFLSDQSQTLNSGTDTPDIYYIILDGFARQDILSNVYGYDESKFINELREMGFYVADRARSNYIQTYLSLPSTLNMTYLDTLAEKYGKKPVDDSAAINLVFDNLVTSKLKKSGYEIVNFVTWWSGTNENFPADVKFSYQKNFQIAGLNINTGETNMVFLQTTLLNPLIKEVWNDDRRGKILTVFEKLPDVSYRNNKKFVLAHITSPHPPYIFTKEGNPAVGADSQSGDEGVEKRGNYIDQLIFISDRIIPILQKLISNSQTPPVIILQSDHGPASIFGRRDDWVKNYSPEGVSERNGILYAVYFPDHDYQTLYDTITPVNTFRLVFNKYFGENMELLPDRTYYTNYDAMYDFSDVTDLH
jgi:hypothetical protein